MLKEGVKCIMCKWNRPYHIVLHHFLIINVIEGISFYVVITIVSYTYMPRIFW